MKKLLFVCAALILVAGFAAPSADAQQCLKFDGFCDGIQIDSISGGNIAATWYHWDCANNFDGMIGKIKNVGNACAGGNGNAGILARTVDGSPVGDYGFILDSLDGTFDMNAGTPGSFSCWIDELAYTQTVGNCTGSFAPDSPQNVPSTR